jgi:SAM-dependent methyltransferase
VSDHAASRDARVARGGRHRNARRTMELHDLGFAAHNILLNGGAATKPGAPVTADAPLTRAVMRTLDIFFPAERRRGSSIVDLGCLEGGYTVEFARAGFDAVGIDARQINIDKCNLVAANLALQNLRFVRDDARNLQVHGTFDVTFCCGLLYHLDRPAEHLRLLFEQTRRLLILHTHYALPDRNNPRFSLSELTEHEGYQGRWYGEFLPDASQDVVEHAVESSYGNYRSFWMERTNLIQALRDVGFSTIYEQPDFVRNNLSDHYIDEQDRSLFIAVR